MVLVSYSEQEHRLHSKAEEHIISISTSDVFVPSAVLHEFDLVLKQNGVSFEDREHIFQELATVIPEYKILSTTPKMLKLAANLDQKATWEKHYFDALVTACALENSADIITTDPLMPNLGVRTVW